MFVFLVRKVRQSSAHLSVHICLCELFIDPPKEQQPGKGKGLTAFCYWLQGKELFLMQQGARAANKREKYKEN